jgi:hypothetical protein
MKIIQNFKQVELVDDIKILTKFFNRQYNPVPDELVEYVKTYFNFKNTVMVYSGAWRFNVEISYIEPCYLRKLEFNYPKLTYFVDHSNEDLLIKLVNKFSNIMFIDSTLTKYKTINELNALFNKFPGCVAAINTNLIIYNRLTTPLKKVAEQLNGRIVGQFIVKDNK